MSTKSSIYERVSEALTKAAKSLQPEAREFLAARRKGAAKALADWYACGGTPEDLDLLLVLPGTAHANHFADLAAHARARLKDHARFRVRARAARDEWLPIRDFVGSMGFSLLVAAGTAALASEKK